MTKNEALALVKKYDMKPCYNNEIEMVQTGWQLTANNFIKELDDLAYKSPDPVYINRETLINTPDLKDIIYTIFVPQNWIN